VTRNSARDCAAGTAALPLRGGTCFDQIVAVRGIETLKRSHAMRCEGVGGDFTGTPRALSVADSISAGGAPAAEHKAEFNGEHRKAEHKAVHNKGSRSAGIQIGRGAPSIQTLGALKMPSLKPATVRR
jgi:hypothetical protein